jgi:pimeloyl-ACP methyl ester carboxylesterase
MLGLIRGSSIVLAIAAGVCLAPIAASSQQPESLAGEWIARLDVGSQPTLMRITVRTTSDKGMTASVTLTPIAAAALLDAAPGRVVDSWRDARVAVDGTSWSFTAGTAPNSLVIAVQTTGNTSSVSVGFRNSTVNAPLRHLATVDKSRSSEYAGAYLLPTGQGVYVWPSGVTGLNYLEEATGSSGTLYPATPTSFVAGPTSLLPDPVRVNATFRSSPNGPMQLIWKEGEGKEIAVARTNTFRREEIRIAGPAGALGCDLLMPVHPGKHSGVVLVPGAGANDRYSLYMIAELFAEHGVATLTCDKRGTGTSEGDWRLTSFEQQAEDVGAGVRYLQRRTEIDASRVGLWSLSEGSWVAPIAVVANPGIAFLIMVAAPATSRRQSTLISNTDRLRREGLSDAEISRFREFTTRYHQFVIDNDAVAIERLWQEYAGASWLPPNMATAKTLNEWSWQRARLTWPYEPMPVLSKITIPLLAIWGANDEEMPPLVHKPLLERAMLAAHNMDYTLKVISAANHTLRADAPSFVQETGYSIEYLRTLLTWIDTKVARGAVK